MPECAFCPHKAKLTGEHIWSEWMGRLFASKKFRFAQRDEVGNVIRQWVKREVDLTAKVVCERCNNGWMSHLENRHAKPAMADLIIGDNDLTISPLRATAIARFAFKTAVIVDHMGRRPPFFERRIRHHFAKTLSIPRDVRMWLTGFVPMVSGRVRAAYHKGTVADGHLKLYVCT